MAIREEIATTEQETKVAGSPVTLTDRAAQELKSLLLEQEKPDAALRVWVAGGGCSGLQYGMALDESAPEEGDQILNDHEIKILVDELSLRYMTGSVVDYVERPVRRRVQDRKPECSQVLRLRLLLLDRRGRHGRAGERRRLRKLRLPLAGSIG